MRFTCAQCGGEVTYQAGGEYYRRCGHDDAGIIAHCSSSLYGEGGSSVENRTLSERAVDAIKQLIQSFSRAPK